MRDSTWVEKRETPIYTYAEPVRKNSDYLLHRITTTKQLLLCKPVKY